MQAAKEKVFTAVHLDLAFDRGVLEARVDAGFEQAQDADAIAQEAKFDRVGYLGMPFGSIREDVFDLPPPVRRQVVVGEVALPQPVWAKAVRRASRYLTCAELLPRSPNDVTG
ncbi:hypothetical protein GCM10027614_70770 [Micromonospora vulcania]